MAQAFFAQGAHDPGRGPIGVLSILAARRAGADEIVAVDIADTMLTFARNAGADRAHNTAAEPDAPSRRARDGSPPCFPNARARSPRCSRT